MISKYYKEFKIKDYMENEKINKSKKVIDCSLGTNPFIKNRKVKKYIKTAKAITNEYPINEYELLKETLLDLYKNNLNYNINKENISFGSGTMGIIRNLSEFLIQEKTKVLGVAPQFTRFISEVELKKGIYDYYELDIKHNYKFIAKDFIEKINKEYSLIYIDNPNNPTGQIIDIEDIEKIIKKAKEYEIIVIIDEAYGDYMKIDNSAINLVGKYDNVVVIRSASKFYGLPNHRIGYIFADKEFIKVYNEISIPFPFSDLSANIFINAIKDYKEIQRTKNKVIKAKEIILKQIEEDDYLCTNIEIPIFTLKVNKNIDLMKELLKNDIISESGNNFLNLDKRYARIRINKKFHKIIEKINKIKEK